MIHEVVEQRSATLQVKSILESKDIDLCFQKTDRKAKKLDLKVKRNMGFSGDSANSDLMNNIKQDL